MAKNIVDLSESGYVRTTTSRIEKSRFSLPLTTTLALAVKKETWRFSLDQEVIYGHFGGLEDNTAEFWLMRAGLEKSICGNKFLRAGLIVPVIARTSSLGDIRDDLPAPKFGGTLGVGAAFRHFRADLALSGDPARSYMEQALRLKVIVGISLVR